MSSHALTILGSSSALPTSQKFSSAQILEIFGRFFLIDCGEGTQMQLRKCKVPFSKIRAIFISHLHGDHYLGIFGVLSSFNLLGRKNDLTIYGPKELEKIIEFQLSFSDHPLQFKVHFIAILEEKKTLLYEDKRISIYAHALNHRKPCWGFEFRQNSTEKKIIKESIETYNLSISHIISIKSGKDLILENNTVIPNKELTIDIKPVSFVYISDTRFMPLLAKEIQSPTLLYHEATFDNKLKKRAKETYHSTGAEAAEFAKLCNAEKLIIGHFSARYKDISPILEEAQNIFPETYAAEDLVKYEF